jgi:microcystin-dependent protein
MSDPFLSEIKIISWNFAPKGWAFCNGQLMPINQNQALFSLLGTTYGGDGRTTFGLPDLRGKIPIHFGSGFDLGQKGGEENHTLTLQELPTHIHVLNVNNGTGNSTNPPNAVLAKAPANFYGAPNNLAGMNPGSVTNTGGSQPHNNMQPYLTLNFIIALQGIFPSRN